MSAAAVPAWDGRDGAVGHAGQPPVVFLHGVGGGKAQWASQLDQLAARGWRALAWDMPGYGESAALAPFTFEGLAASLVGLLDALDIGRAVLVGHSMGGMVALETVARTPERVAGLVLACTSPAFGRPGGEFQRQFLAERLAPLDAGLGMAAIAAQQVPRMMRADAPAAARERAIAIMGAVPEATYRAALAALSTFDRREVLPRIAVPTLALAATGDAQAPAAVMQKMAGFIHGCEFELLDGCAHLANLEAPAAFGAAVLDFLARRIALH